MFSPPPPPPPPPQPLQLSPPLPHPPPLPLPLPREHPDGGFLHGGPLMRNAPRNFKEQLSYLFCFPCNCNTCSLKFLEKCLIRGPPYRKPPVGSSRLPELLPHPLPLPLLRYGECNKNDEGSDNLPDATSCPKKTTKPTCWYVSPSKEGRMEARKKQVT